jgi:hypothetical protein
LCFKNIIVIRELSIFMICKHAILYAYFYFNIITIQRQFFKVLNIINLVTQSQWYSAYICGCKSQMETYFLNFFGINEV